MKLFVFCFGWMYGIPVETLKLLKQSSLIQELEKQDQFVSYFGVNKNKANSLVMRIENDDFTHIIGLASFRKDAKLIRFEQEFMNKYGRNTIENNGPETIVANWNPPELTGTIKTNYAGNGPCNLVSYKILRSIQSRNAATKYLFCHIPKLLDPEVVTETILEIIRFATI